LINFTHELAEWLSKSVKTISQLKSFDDVQSELISIAQYIVKGKVLTKRSCSKLVDSLKNMQKEMLSKMNIVLFVTPTIKINFKENIKKIVVEDQEECIDIAYAMKDELKYLLYMNNEEVSVELENSVDIVITFEEIIKAANACFPIDIFTYDRLYLTAKLNEIENKKSKILFTGSSHIISEMKKDNTSYLSTNLAVNNQDLYYTLLSIKEAIKRSPELETIVISFPYYFLFNDINSRLSKNNILTLSKVDYPIYKKLNGYKGELLPVYSNKEKFPIYEAIADISLIRDIYHNALIKELESLEYYNKINLRPKFGVLDYDFLEYGEKNFDSIKSYMKEYNDCFDLDRGLYNKKLLDSFLDNMEELNKKIILIVPPVTKFYRAGILNNMANSYKELIGQAVNAHKCCKFVDLFNSEEFNEEDFQDYEYLNVNGVNKLSQLIEKLIK